MAVSLRNVSYTYRGKFRSVRAVDGVSYDFEPGKCYCILGKSGSGKSTLLSLMAGLDLPEQGEILVDGVSTRDWDRNRMRREVVSVIYQHYNLFPLLTVQENIQYPMRLRNVPKREAIQRAKLMRERVDLPESYDHRLPSQLSGGEQQRVAIARTLAQGCNIVLADEPTGNLDTENSRNVVDNLVRMAHEDGCVVIIVTHDTDIAERADAVLHMKDGRWTE